MIDFRFILFKIGMYSSWLRGQFAKLLGGKTCAGSNPVISVPEVIQGDAQSKNFMCEKRLKNFILYEVIYKWQKIRVFLKV